MRTATSMVAGIDDQVTNTPIEPLMRQAPRSLAVAAQTRVHTGTSASARPSETA